MNRTVLIASSLLILLYIFYSYIQNTKNTYYDKGVYDTVNHYNKAVDELVKAQEELNKTIINNDHKDAIDNKTKEVVTVYEIKKVVEYVTKEIEVPVGCDKLASDFIRVRSEATNIINRAATRTNP